LRVSDGLDAAVATDDDIIGASAPAGFRPLRFGPFAADALALGW
jgi:hypothetical protein